MVIAYGADNSRLFTIIERIDVVIVYSAIAAEENAPRTSRLQSRRQPNVIRVQPSFKDDS